MFKKKILIGIVILTCVLLFCLGEKAGAITLKTEKEALEDTFPRVDSVINEEKTLTLEQEKIIKQRLGGKMVSFNSSSAARLSNNQKRFRFYFGLKDGSKTHAAIILEEPGKMGIITFIVVIDLSGKIMNIDIMSYSETRGRSVGRSRFLNQFIGKTSKDAFQLKKDIIPVSGATISSRAVAFVAKKAVVLYEELYLKGN